MRDRERKKRGRINKAIRMHTALRFQFRTNLNANGRIRAIIGSWLGMNRSRRSSMVTCKMKLGHFVGWNYGLWASDWFNLYIYITSSVPFLSFPSQQATTQSELWASDQFVSTYPLPIPSSEKDSQRGSKVPLLSIYQVKIKHHNIITFKSSQKVHGRTRIRIVCITSRVWDWMRIKN